MLPLLLLAALLAPGDPERLAPGDHLRPLLFDGTARPYRLHIPPLADLEAPRPVVLVLHSFATPAALMPIVTGMNTQADAAGFLAVYPEGTGNPVRWNSGGFPGQDVDDVGYIQALLDDLATIAPVDPKRVYATGMSNGGMMCYRLASELSDRIAAIAPVAGTMTIPKIEAKRPVPVIHFHGTEDTLVPYDAPRGRTWRGMRMLSVPESIEAWVKANGGPPTAAVETPIPDSDPDDGTTAVCLAHDAPNGGDVVLIRIDGGGHTWPGRPARLRFLGKSSGEVDATARIWAFFKAHPMP